MALIIKASAVRSDGTVNGYVVALPNGATAFLNSVSGRGWELIIQRGGGDTERRGLFASTKDIMSKLDAEFNSVPVAQWPQIERRSRPRA
jgi:hypothetical protein